MNKRQFIVVGISNRALLATMGPMRSECLSIDFYSDRDTSPGLANSIRINDFDEVACICKSIGQANRRRHVLWSGGIENRIDVVRAVEQIPNFRNLGCRSDSMQRVREPGAVAIALKQAGIPALDVRSSLSDCSETQWIVKPLKSGGGEQVHLLADGRLQVNPTKNYLQQFVAGPVFGAAFIGRKKNAEYIGCCRHLPTTSTALPFRYEGSIGPASIAQTVTGRVREIGKCIAKTFGIRGWFGVDFVVDNEQAWLLEVNPRFTSSMELLDGRTVPSIFAAHLRAFGILSRKVADGLSDAPRTVRKPIAAKLTLFNDTTHNLFVDSSRSDALWHLNQTAESTVCDVPCHNWNAVPGSPVCTIRSEGDSESDVLQRLSLAKKTVTSILK